MLSGTYIHIECGAVGGNPITGVAQAGLASTATDTCSLGSTAATDCRTGRVQRSMTLTMLPMNGKAVSTPVNVEKIMVVEEGAVIVTLVLSVRAEILVGPRRRRRRRRLLLFYEIMAQARRCNCGPATRNMLLAHWP